MAPPHRLLIVLCVCLPALASAPPALAASRIAPASPVPARERAGPARVADSEGQWAQIPLQPPFLRGHTAVYDPSPRRMIVFGGLDRYGNLTNDVWVMPLDGDSDWAILVPGGVQPSARREHGAVYDPVNDRMVVFGGMDAGGNSFGDAWSLSLGDDPAWAQLEPGGDPPPARHRHSAIYDAVRDRMVVFGGQSAAGSLTDTWALSLGAVIQWQQLGPGGVPPGGLFGEGIHGHAAIFDPLGNRMIVFGGFTGLLDESRAWELSFAGEELGASAWNELAPAGTLPGGRSEHTAIYDPVGERMLVCAGLSLALPEDADVWALSLGAGPEWSEIAGPGSLPDTRYEHTAIYDEAGDRMVIFAGCCGLNDAWALPLRGFPIWSELPYPEDPPSNLFEHEAILDPVRDRMIALLGAQSVGGSSTDVWALGLAGELQWTLIDASGTPPSAPIGAAAIYDAPRDRIVVFGGLEPEAYSDRTWALDLAGAPAWEELAPAGGPPAARRHASAIYDPVNDRMVIFGGFGIGGFRNDVWALSLAAGAEQWTELAPAGGPPDLRAEHSAIYDSRRGRMVVFAGLGGPVFFDPVYFNDTWALSLEPGAEAWSELVPAGAAPNLRRGHTAIYDPVRDRMVMFGGEHENSYFNQPYALSFKTFSWAPLLASGRYPSERYLHTAVYDGTRDRMLMSGGLPPQRRLRTDTWELAWSEPTPVLISLVAAEVRDGAVEVTWHAGSGAGLVATVQRRTAATAWADIATVSADGSGRLSFLDRVPRAGERYGYRLGLVEDGEPRFAGEVWVEVPAAARLALYGMRPNPASGDAAVWLALPAQGPATLELLDLSGRRLLAQDLGSLGPGGHLVRLEAARIPPGLYLLRLSHAGRAVTARAVFVR